VDDSKRRGLDELGRLPDGKRNAGKSQRNGSCFCLLEKGERRGSFKREQGRKPNGCATRTGAKWAAMVGVLHGGMWMADGGLHHYFNRFLTGFSAGFYVSARKAGQKQHKGGKNGCKKTAHGCQK